MKHLYSFFTMLGIVAIASAQTTTNVTFSVDMNNEVVSANGVHIAGSFQDWNPASTELTDTDMDGVYTISIDVADPSLLEFKFINGNDWSSVEDVPDACQVEVGGNDNRFLFATGSVGTTEYSVCYGSCAACGVTTVRFRVDMSAETVSPNGVHVAGNFQNWDPSTTEMFDFDADGIYETIASFVADSTQSIVFKFINGNSWIDPNENLSGSDCEDGNGNRVLLLGSENVVMSVLGTTTPVCYNSCGSCVLPSMVTLRVDMTTQAAVSENGVHVAGNFQGWSPSDTPLDDSDGDGIWEVVLEMAPGDYQFKFVNGNDWGGNGAGNVDNEMIVGDCVADGNRTLTVGAEAVIYETCYNSCPGVACLPDPEDADITFRVNMSDEDVSTNGVYLIGSFTSPAWQSGALALADDDGDGVWEITTLVSGSAEVLYKFANGDPFLGGEPDYSVEETGYYMGADSVEISFETDGCGVPNGFGAYNRLHVRSGLPEVLDIACYNRCSDCGTGIDILNVNEFTLYPNPASNIVVLEVSSAIRSAVVSITDSSGRLVYNNKFNSLNGSTSLNVSQLSPGFYQVAVVNGNVSSVKRLVIQ
ncbi:MAG: hypothetical protein COA49_05430 [Bacteroidetes bacterium]|nr:MAG: hypothetical protein COA49_05430 [Bacteroidota bacterium]